MGKPTLECSTINLRVLAAAAAFASKDETRYYLNGVLLEIEPRSVTYIATDGITMIVYRRDIDDPETPDNLLTGSFIIPTQHCKSHKLEKEDDGLAKIFGKARLTIAYNFVDLSFAPIDGVYPDWRRIIPRGSASGVLAQFNLKRLGDFAKFGQAIEHGSPFVAHNGTEGPAMVWYPGAPNCFGIIMPIKLTNELSRSAPSWAIAPSNHIQGDIEDVLDAADKEQERRLEGFTTLADQEPSEPTPYDIGVQDAIDGKSPTPPAKGRKAYLKGYQDETDRRMSGRADVIAAGDGDEFFDSASTKH